MATSPARGGHGLPGFPVLLSRLSSACRGESGQLVVWRWQHTGFGARVAMPCDCLSTQPDMSWAKASSQAGQGLCWAPPDLVGMVGAVSASGLQTTAYWCHPWEPEARWQLSGKLISTVSRRWSPPNPSQPPLLPQEESWGELQVQAPPASPCPSCSFNLQTREQWPFLLSSHPRVTEQR